ncbi:MAG TPA: multidrug effflux MFS transporter [Stellaceae bacterium]|nr:multidrug effflux MFS transporter [Stellaceae bacterium]
MPRSLLIVVLALLTAFGPMSIDMYLPGLPVIATDLRADYGGAELTLSTFFLGFACSQVIYGPLADRLGRRRPLLAGIAIYILGSIGCALAHDITMLIACRFFQAAGCSAGPMLARTIVRDLYTGARVARVLSIMMTVMGCAPMLAPIIGGQILVHADWRAIFWLGAGFAAVMFLIILVWLPETLPPERRLAGHGFGNGIGAMAGSYAIMLRHPLFLSYALGGSLVFGGVLAYLAGSPQVFITLHHVTPQTYALLFALNIVGLIGVSALNAWVVARFGVERMLGIGIAAAAAAGVALVGVSFSRIDSVALLVPPLFCFVASLGMVGANGIAGCLNIFPERAGAASALFGCLQMTSGAILGALVGWAADGTARPMAVFVCAGGVLALAAQRGLAYISRRQHRRDGHAALRGVEYPTRISGSE